MDGKRKIVLQFLILVREECAFLAQQLLRGTSMTALFHRVAPSMTPGSLISSDLKWFCLTRKAKGLEKMYR